MNNDLIRFKSDEVRDEFGSPRLNPRIRALTFLLASLAYLKFGHIITLTDVFRSKSADSGVHEAWRGVDVRTKDMDDGVAQSLCLIINQLVPFDLKESHPSAFYHNVLGTAHPEGSHIHLQVCA